MFFPRETDGPLPSHLERLTRLPLLSAADEVRLAERARTGDAGAKARLVESNMRLVIAVARSYRSRQIPLEDLVQEGVIGLMMATERFDPGRGFRFSTYATHWIRQAIGRALDTKSKAIRLPAHVEQAIRRIERRRGELATRFGREPTDEELAHALEMTTKKLRGYLDAVHEVLSLEAPVGESGGATLGGLIRDPSECDAETELLANEVLSELSSLLTELTERERRVMNARYPIGGQPSPPVEIESELRITRDRIRQIELGAMRKLRDAAHRRKLADVFGREPLRPEAADGEDPTAA